MSKLLRELEKAGVFSELDVELATTLSRLGQESDPDVQLAVALASREVQGGHVCADLTRLAGRPSSEGDAERGHTWPALGPWLERLGRSALVGSGAADSAVRPLVLDSQGRLYLARYFDHERRVGELLRTFAADELAAPALDTSFVDRLFVPRADGSVDRQRQAALESRARKLSIIVGGPGTGKTSTVVKLLALLVHDALSTGKKPPRTLLVAPTGKAAARLTESIERAREQLPVEEPIKRAIESAAFTVHRALMPLEGSLTRFRHNAEQPLDCDVLLLDEASMVDLALMRRLLDAVPAGARVILLGDPDQLASVEAGGVLGDICRAAEQGGGPLSARLSRLSESYRYPEGSGISALAKAVHAEDAERALAVLRGDYPDVVFHAALPPAGLSRVLEQEARAHYAALRESELEPKLGALDHFRVLCAHRQGPASVELLNPLLSRVVRGRSASANESYAGRPILITQNDYGTELFNGDVGVLHSERRGAELSACFRVADQRVRRVALARLPSHESVYAMTVHKSQGSEFEHVAIVLPDRPSAILSRELLYTAITRAKQGVSLYASERSLRAAIAHRVQRSSGLADRLR